MDNGHNNDVGRYCDTCLIVEKYYDRYTCEEYLGIVAGHEWEKYILEWVYRCKVCGVVGFLENGRIHISGFDGLSCAERVMKGIIDG